MRGAEIQLAQARLDAADKSIDQILETRPSKRGRHCSSGRNLHRRRNKLRIKRAHSRLSNTTPTRKLLSPSRILTRQKKSLVALLALDAANAPALELQDKIQNARVSKPFVYNKNATANNKSKICLGKHNPRLPKKTMMRRTRRLRRCSRLDASNASARNLQKQIQDARERAELTPLTSSERIFAPPGVPERAETNLKSPTPAIVSATRSQGFPTRYALPIAGVIILALAAFRRRRVRTRCF